jgi:hypothetical protein
MSFSLGFGWTGRSGSAPSPFDAVDGSRLAGLAGSHPLHQVAVEELVRPSSGPVVGEITIDAPAMVGGGITGTVRLQALERVEGRKAALRLVGLRLDEEEKSESHEDSEGNTTRTETWVEANGTLFIQDAYLEPVVPATMEPGQAWEARFAIPAPRLGPPTAHLGESIIAWAIEIRWDIARGTDDFVADHVPIAQHPDLIRAGVGKQGGQSVMAGVPVGDAMISVATPLPAPAGSEIVVGVRWPSAPGGTKGRVEIQRKTNAPNGIRGIVASVDVDPAAFKGGTEVRLAVPAGSAPSFDGAGLEITYIIRALVDRRLRSDAAIERPVAIV